MKIQIKFVWYDIWIGFFWDKKKRWLYICLLPCIPIILKFPIYVYLEFEQNVYKIGSILKNHSSGVHGIVVGKKKEYYPGTDRCRANKLKVKLIV